ncbi:MAG: cache domain-containing protein [Magnetospirillum sp.]|nr:cache domain-containing protein [Magnetospirillum sp.]
MLRSAFRLAGGLAVAAFLASAPAHAQVGPKADEVVAFVKKAVAHIDAVGEEKAFADFSDTASADWVKGELYIFCHNIDGTNVAHGGNPALRGKNVVGFKDPDGLAVNVLIFDKVKAEGKGWVEYKWPNPLTKKVEPKAIYSELVKGKYACGSGYYK